MEVYSAPQERSVFTYAIRQDEASPTMGVHYHNTFEVYYLLKGTCWYFIDGRSYRLFAGDIALIPPGVIHKASYDEPISSRSLFNCSEDYIPRSVRPLLAEIPYFAKSEATEDLIRDIFQVIQKEYNEPDAFSADVIRNKVAQLLLTVAREGSKPHDRQESPIAERAGRYIRDHYAESVTLQDVAQYCFVSREHLSRIFKKETGFGFNEYLNIYRLKKANTLLMKQPRSRVAEIALSCGFGDSNYFSKQYKKMYGISPTDSRKEDQ